ncbi:cobyrinate a,c-diamide synthase [Bacteroides sp. 51]|uniref:cobyrinate a,c-diamide synthase n=1 Tax=Bacteroides sp. 51 TaxID=2302938 RepID=UPI0013D216E4|nr:cobyrinate a,c-diamide synthase [Bacteroides sp. 51]NDV82005.1 cobyrinate a,c-diamide synthase [Bacteroides sp. 51]
MKQITRPQFLIAAPTSGTGKTTLSMGLMKLLTRKGKKVQPFKCGPDYIDTRFHEIAAGLPSVNLDTFMATEDHVKQLYHQYTHDAEICIVEGMMGLFDGYDGRKGSSANIARLLDIPVILVIDAKSTSYSVAAQIYGFKNFDPQLRVAGVIFNRVGSERHELTLRNACQDTGVPCIGCIRRNEELSLKSRYLGLDISPKENKQIIEAWADVMDGQIDLDLLLEQTMCPVPVYIPSIPKSPDKKLRIAVARNKESFAFIYEETITKFRELGQVIFFNPEYNKRLPKNIDLLYLPGGYPEKRLRELALVFDAKDELLRYNMHNDIREYIENGGRTLAECGGMIYLSKGVYHDNLPDLYTSMLEVLPFTIDATKYNKRLILGYRQFEYNGQQLRGHEFHYTQIYGYSKPISSVVQVYNATGQPIDTPVFRYKNVIASYTHLYLGETDIMQLWNDNQNS